jgi:hypothetical protein
MEKRFRSSHYRFRIQENRGCFSIEATDLASLKYSSVNNVVGIMGELVNGDTDNPLFWDSKWFLPPNLTKKIFERAVDMFSDGGNVKRLERCLDEDKSCGEWENQRRNRKF